MSITQAIGSEQNFQYNTGMMDTIAAIGRQLGANYIGVARVFWG
jgi:hypothetical protein